MKAHEKGCTASPNRVCGFCGNSEPVSTLIDLLGDGKDLTKLRGHVDNCPGCILAAIRQSKLQVPNAEEDGFFRVDFDFKKERDEWRACENDERWEGVAFNYYG